jgi:hypothetical protein
MHMLPVLNFMTLFASLFAVHGSTSIFLFLLLHFAGYLYPLIVAFCLAHYLHATHQAVVRNLTLLSALNPRAPPCSSLA